MRKRRSGGAGAGSASPSASPTRAAARDSNDPPAAGGGLALYTSWAAAFCVSAALGLYAASNFHTAFPLTSLEITVDREQALASAAALAAELSLRPLPGGAAVMQAASFEKVDELQTFVELEHGLPTWVRMLQRSELSTCSPYSWVVRHFAEAVIAETEVPPPPLPLSSPER